MDLIFLPPHSLFPVEDTWGMLAVVSKLLKLFDPSRNSDSSSIEGRGCDLNHGDVVIAAITLSLIHISEPTRLLSRSD